MRDADGNEYDIEMQNVATPDIVFARGGTSRSST